MTPIRYLLDTNIVIGALKKISVPRTDLFVLEDVYTEAATSDERIEVMKKAGVQIIKTTFSHYIRLKEVMAAHGGNLQLIRLFTNKGSADLVLIAFALEEKINTQHLFPFEYVIVTKDNELSNVATGYGLAISKIIP